MVELWSKIMVLLEIVKTLLSRRDITVTLVCVYGGKFYRIIIPAGADISSLVKGRGSLTFASLAKTFGATLAK